MRKHSPVQTAFIPAANSLQETQTAPQRLLELIPSLTSKDTLFQTPVETSNFTEALACAYDLLDTAEPVSASSLSALKTVSSRLMDRSPAQGLKFATQCYFQLEDRHWHETDLSTHLLKEIKNLAQGATRANFIKEREDAAVFFRTIRTDRPIAARVLSCMTAPSPASK